MWPELVQLSTFLDYIQVLDFDHAIFDMQHDVIL